jgi:signal transduction histidine kinase/CheY-like chemotaxis protein
MLFTLFRTLMNAGAGRAKSDIEASKIRYLNYCLIFGITLFIPNLLYEAYLQLHVTVAIDVIFLVCIFVSYAINSRGYYFAARNLIILNVNFVLLAGTYAEGVAAGNYLVFIPIFFVFSVLGRFKDKFYQLAILAIITAICMLVTFFAMPQYSPVQNIPLSIVETMFRGNFMIAVCLTLIFSYLINRVTEKKEEQLISAKDLAEDSAKAKLQFLSNMSHELRTPLNGIIGTANLLSLDAHTQTQKEHLELLQYSSVHMLNLINDVLDFSKIESGKIELEQKSFNLEAFVKNIYNSFAQQFEAKQLYFKLAAEENLDINIISDDVKLGQILNNLLGNALKFTAQGGVTLVINTAHIYDDEVNVSIRVTDTGIGIPASKLSTVFESFMQADANTTRKYGGTGLGLSISKKLAEVFKSTLHVQSEVNKGSSFYFDIVLKKSNKPVEPVAISKNAIVPLDGLTVLLAEDNKINMLIARKFLSKWGVNLTEATNGREAIEHYQLKKYDIVLLDLEMPEVDGYGALKGIRQINPSQPAMAFTAAIFENLGDVLLAHGFDDYILKPFVPQELNAKLAKYCLTKVLV